MKDFDAKFWFDHCTRLWYVYVGKKQARDKTPSQALERLFVEAAMENDDLWK